jgi:hypothetical protein
MSKNEPTLRIGIFKRENPRCSVCGEEFGSEGLAKGLLDAFALHVRRRHMNVETTYGVAREQAARATPARA